MSFMRTISKRATFPWHCAHILSCAGMLLPPILLPEKQNTNQLLAFKSVITKSQAAKKKMKAVGFEPQFFRIVDYCAIH